MRVFIGIDFDSEFKREISHIQSIIRQNSQRGRFKYINNFHLTLKFLGELGSSKISEVNNILGLVAAQYEPFDLNIDKMGFFNGRGSIHALWLGFGGNIDRLRQLHKNIEQGLENIGIEPDKRLYTPHITLAQDILLAVQFDELKRIVDISKLGTVYVKEIQLIKSEQIDNKRIYTPLSVFQLK